MNFTLKMWVFQSLSILGHNALYVSTNVSEYYSSFLKIRIFLQYISICLHRPPSDLTQKIGILSCENFHLPPREIVTYSRLVPQLQMRRGENVAGGKSERKSAQSKLKYLREEKNLLGRLLFKMRVVIIRSEYLWRRCTQTDKHRARRVGCAALNPRTARRIVCCVNALPLK